MQKYPTHEIEIALPNGTFLAEAEIGPNQEHCHVECSRCGEEIFFAKTKKGKFIPVDSEPEGEIYTSHFASCAFADQFRKT